MPLTLVGHAFTCLVADSPRARLSAAWCAPAAPIKQSAVSGYNSHPTTRYSPLPVTFCEPARRSADGRATSGETGRT